MMNVEALAGPSEHASSTHSALCAICAANGAKYTCPRCATRTCSLPCSNAHKTHGQGCSGMRNKAAYVPMNRYGYMALMDDYVFLEDVGRNVGSWGREIVQGGYMAGAGADGKRGRGGMARGRGRGRGATGHAGGQTRSKRDVLKMQLDFRDIEMDLLPNGMERRTLNQSTWDYKTKAALLTVEFKFHPSPDPLTPAAQPPREAYSFITHRNSLDNSLFSIMQAQVTERSKSKKDKYFPPWLRSLVFPDPDDPDAFTIPTCVMRTPVDPLASLQTQARPSLHPGHIRCEAYYRLDPTRPLGTVLKHKTFAEFPTVEVWEEGAFRGAVVDDRGAVQRDADEHRRKRRKLNTRQGKKAITGLLGGYGSDEEEGEAEERNVLNLLDGYAGSDDDDDPDTGGTEPPGANEPIGDDEDAEGETDDELDQGPEDLAVLLEQLREAGALRDPGTDGVLSRLGEDEEQLDWGDSGDENDG